MHANSELSNELNVHVASYPTVHAPLPPSGSSHVGASVGVNILDVPTVPRITSLGSANVGADSPDVRTAPSGFIVPPADVRAPQAIIISDPADVRAPQADVSSCPAIVRAPPTNVSSHPANVSSSPADVSSGPAIVRAPPTNISSHPANVSSSPVDVNSGPAIISSSPADVRAPQADVNSSLANVSAPSADVSAPSADVSAPSADVSSPPANVSSSPADVRAPQADVSSGPAIVTSDPADVSSPPANVSSHPTDASAPSAGVRAPPAIVISDPADIRLDSADIRAPPGDVCSNPADVSAIPIDDHADSGGGVSDSAVVPLIASDSGDGHDSDMDVDDGNDSRASGRISEANIEILKKEFQTVRQIAKDIATKTGLSPAQVFDYWNYTNTRTHVKWNMWNLYSAYFKEHEKEELARLPGSIPSGVIEPSVRQQCYEAFTATVGLEKAKEILAKHRMVQLAKGGQGQSVAERKTEFRKAAAKLTEMMNNYEAVYGFSGVFGISGTLPNSDGGLAVVHETGNAVGFFETRCRTSRNEMVSHLKAHVFNNHSLNVVALTFDSPDSQRTNVVASLGLTEVPGPSSKPSTPSTPLKPSKPSKPSKLSKSKELQEHRCVSNQATRAHGGPTLDDEEPEDQKGLGIWITEYLIKMLNGLGLVPWKSLPWKSLGQKLASAGVHLKNWPEGVPFPPIAARKKRKGKKDQAVEADDNDDDNDDNEPKKKVPKSLQALSLDNLHFIYLAIRDENHPLRFERYAGRTSDLEEGRGPIIWGAPPLAVSKFTHGRRLFIDGRIDQHGVRRLPKPPGCEDGEGDHDHESPPDDTNNNNEDKPSTNRGTKADSSNSDKGKSRQKEAKTLGDASDSMSDSSDGRFHPVKVPIRTSPVRSKPLVTPPVAEYIDVSSGSESESTPATQQRVRFLRPSQSQRQPAPVSQFGAARPMALRLKRKLETSDSTPTLRKGKGKQKDDVVALKRSPSPDPGVNLRNKRPRVDDRTHVESSVGSHVPSPLDIPLSDSKAVLDRRPDTLSEGCSGASNNRSGVPSDDRLGVPSDGRSGPPSDGRSNAPVDDRVNAPSSLHPFPVVYDPQTGMIFTVPLPGSSTYPTTGGYPLGNVNGPLRPAFSNPDLGPPPPTGTPGTQPGFLLPSQSSQLVVATAMSPQTPFASLPPPTQSHPQVSLGQRVQFPQQSSSETHDQNVEHLPGPST